MGKTKKKEVDMDIEELERRKVFFTKKIQDYGFKMDKEATESYNHEVDMQSEVEILDDMIQEFTTDGAISVKDDKELEESIVKRDKLKQSINIASAKRQTIIGKTQKKIQICKQKLDDIEGDIMYLTREDEENGKTDEEKLEEIKEIVKSDPELLEEAKELKNESEEIVKPNGD